LPLFLQKESGVWGEAPFEPVKKREKAFCTLFTDERLKKAGKNFHISVLCAENIQGQGTKVPCRGVHNRPYAIALLAGLQDGLFFHAEALSSWLAIVPAVSRG
jgi:hypothetical protein